MRDGKILRFSCQVGHVFTDEGLSYAHSDAVESAMWVALRALEETAALHRRLEEHARAREMDNGYEQRAIEAEARARVVRQALINEPTGDAEHTAAAAKVR
jgi:two-component system chemotaxis response regulator CheB